jgi:hypothetical protein
VQTVTRRFAFRAAVAALAVIVLVSPLAPILSSDAANSPYHWARTTSQFTLQVGNNFSGGWDSLFRRAVSEWNENDTVTLKAVGGGTNAQDCSPKKGKVEVCNWRYGQQEGWLGLTRLYFNDRGDHIDSATVQMNDSFFDANGKYNDDRARRHTICHELGHSMGLDHVNTGSCMNDSQDAVFNNTSPNNKDFAQLASIYKHKDKFSTLAGSQKKKDKHQDKSGKKGKKGKKGKNRKNDKREQRKAARQKLRERKRAKRAQAEDFFSPTSLPAVPSGLDADETVTVQSLDDGTTVVSFITWADGD